MMRRRRLSLVIAAIGIAALALGLGLGLGGSASAAATARGSAATARGSVATSRGSAATVSLSSERPVVINCLGRAQTRPGSFTLACADGNDYLTALSWTSWTPALASGSGTEVINDCVPYCAAGHFHRFPVLAVLWGNAALHGNPGTLRYTKVTLIYTGTRPKVFNGHPGTVTDSLWA